MRPTHNGNTILSDEISPPNCYSLTEGSTPPKRSVSSDLGHRWLLNKLLKKGA